VGDGVSVGVLVKVSVSVGVRVMVGVEVSVGVRDGVSVGVAVYTGALAACVGGTVAWKACCVVGVVPQAVKSNTLNTKAQRRKDTEKGLKFTVGMLGN